MISAQNRLLEPLLTMGSKYDYAEKRLLLVGTGGIKRRPVMEALRALGLGRIICLHYERNWAKDFVDDWIDGDPVFPSEETLQIVKKRAGKLDAVYTYDDYSVILTAFLSERLGLPGIPASVAQTAKNKVALRKLCAQSGLPTARFTYCAPGESDVIGSMGRAGMTFPVVLKPAHGAGSILVRRVNDEAELAYHLASYTAALGADPVTTFWPDTGVLVEEYLAGPEVDIDLLIQNGSVRYAVVTDNFAPVEPYFMELGGEIPSALPLPVQSELITVAARTLHALGAHNVCAHFEARFTSRGGVPIEAN
ncbi:MAG: ATP-grasp domain-containing protein, partial [Candidatus Nitrosocosmicus sp.]